MSEKYINFDINDERAGAIAEVLANKTSKKILSLIAEKEISEGDISTELHMPLNTVGYNVNKLLKAGLIEKSKNFFWSAKGKKILTYKLSNKKIVISPKSVFSGVLPALLVSFLGAGIVRFYYLKQIARDGFSQAVDFTYSQGSEAAATVSKITTPSGIIEQSAVAANYSWLWFLLGALLALLIILIFNWRKTR